MLVTWGILLPDNYLRAPPFRSSKIKEMYKVRKVKSFPCQSMWKMAFLWMENWNSRCFLLQIGLWIHKHQENSILNVTNTKPAVKPRSKRKKARTDKKVWRCNTILIELFEIGNRRLAQTACLPPSILGFPDRCQELVASFPLCGPYTIFLEIDLLNFIWKLLFWTVCLRQMNNPRSFYLFHFLIFS